MKVSITNRIPSEYNQGIIRQLLQQVETQLNLLSEGRAAAGLLNASVAPTTGSYAVGDFVNNSAPSLNSSVIPGVDAQGILIGWENTSSGSPGTMTPVYGLTGSGTGVSVAPGVPAGVAVPYFGFNPPSGWYLVYGQTLNRTTDATLWAAIHDEQTVTMTIASPCVVTWNPQPTQGLQNNDPIIFRTSGALPTGLTAGTKYYVKGLSGNNFNVSATPGGAAINTSGTQSGTHTGIRTMGTDGDGSTTFTLPDPRGEAFVGRDAMGGTAANRVTSGGSGINGDTPGATGGAETVTLTTAQLATHSHNQQNWQFGGGTSTGNALQTDGAGSVVSSNMNTGNAGSGSAHNNMPPVLICNYIIKR